MEDRMSQLTTPEARTNALLAGAILEEYRDVLNSFDTLEMAAKKKKKTKKKKDFDDTDTCKQTDCGATCTCLPKPKPPKKRKALSWTAPQF
jgi:hypothetical protein